MPGVSSPALDSSSAPPFTIKELRDAIPKHCFQRSLIRSFSFVLRDFILIGFIFWVGLKIDSICVGSLEPLAYILWPIYWFVQGVAATGLWVLAHECGHEAFSDYQFINNTVGLILHSILLVPYHSWRITHRKHHKGTSHMDKDSVFVPRTETEARQMKGLITAFTDSPIVSIFQIVMMLLLGWPGYLIGNAWSQKYPRRTNHFEPSSPLFKPEERHLIIVSDVALVVVIASVISACFIFSPMAVLKHYFVPYLWVNFWLVLITYLQHTDADIPHYRGEEWTFVRGALATVDRDYGLVNIFLHHIGDTHVAHHLFSTMPHYHAVEATQHLRVKLGKYYRRDTTPILKALWKSWHSCHYVKDKGNVLYYQAITAKKA